MTTRPDFARLPVLAVTAAYAVVLLAFSGRYDLFGDELYFLAAGQHLDWGYADQGPLAPLLALVMDSLFPGSLTALRLPTALLTVAGTAVAALIARELGGGARAQVVTAVVFAGAPVMISGGHLLGTGAADTLAWELAVLVLLRWLHTRRDVLLLWLGVVTAFAWQAKFLMVGFWAVLLVCALVFGPRELLRRPMLWLGAGIAVLATVPALLWQARHGWPQLGMTGQIAAEAATGTGGALGFVPIMLFGAGLLTGAVLVVYGTWRLLRGPQWRPYAFLGWTFLGLVLVFLVVGGRPYYVNGLFPLLWAVGAIEVERRVAARWWRWAAAWPVAVASALAMLFLALPVQPVERAAARDSADFTSVYSTSWTELADQVAAAYHRLPPEQRARTAVLTVTYWQAGALDRYGPERGLPRAYSGSRGYWYFGAPPESADTVLFAGPAVPYLTESFAQVQQLSTMDTRLKSNLLVQDVPLQLATGRTGSWAELWPRFQKLG
ncbi:glycosyltransferase family 39 protein [Crossiella sp. CA-258035]|uniref:glycosyltransferase family 39 protein n=1 Tax=Crossiella sp. CA-258035 TaxID=2981138 RepID=UPI0024BC4CFC|nr:glycosyltransferase family 39 protein [Crossiella sp. CA-258035]WHT21068.1 glycosyltransferase family 39 protein [Crossiella sp. CA-258035]